MYNKSLFLKVMFYSLFEKNVYATNHKTFPQGEAFFSCVQTGQNLYMYFGSYYYCDTYR